MAMSYSSGFNLEKLRVSLYRKQTAVENGVEAAVDAAAILIRDEARANVPVDTHNLESAIHVSNRRTRAGNHAIDIEVSGVGEDGRDVDEYALVIEELYDFLIASGVWTMGEGTQAKQASDPTRHIGSGYMTRAIEAKKGEAVALIKAAVRAAI